MKKSLYTGLALIVNVAVLSGCSSTPKQDEAATFNNEVTTYNPDPWEGFNRKVFVFNDTLDKYFLKPIAKGYKAVTPDPVEQGVSNVFGNLVEVRNVLNSALQWKWKHASQSTGRFLINSTVGLVGIFDVAQHVGLKPSENEDFGQTLAVWGVGSGPYLVLPLLGSSTVRDGLGMPVDGQVNLIYEIDHVPTRNTVIGTSIIDTRAKLLNAEELVSGDRYSFIRDAYLQHRQYLIDDGQVTDDFGGDLEGGYDSYDNY